MLNAVVQWLFSQNGTIGSSVGLGLVALYYGVLFYRSRRRLIWAETYNSQIGLSPVEAGLTDNDRESQLFQILHFANKISVFVLEVRNPGPRTITPKDYLVPLHVRFPGRVVVDFRTSRAEPAPLYGAVNVGTRVSGICAPQQDANGRPDIAGSLDRSELRADFAAVERGVSSWSEDKRDSRRQITLPTLELAPGERFRLLVDLRPSDDIAYEMAGRIRGRLTDATVNRARRWRVPAAVGAAGVVLAVLLVLSFVLPGVSLIPPRYCADGTAVVAGSSAFAPAVQTIAQRYDEECHGATVTVEPVGSNDGYQRLLGPGPHADRAAVTDGQPADPTTLQQQGVVGRPVAVVVLTLVVNPEVRLDGLTTAQVRDVFRGRYTNWRQLGSPLDAPIRLVGRGAESGSRSTFERHVLGTEESELTSNSCDGRDRPNVRPDLPIRCERDSTADVLQEVATTPGAIGYADSADVGTTPVIRLRLDGDDPSLDTLRRGYPFWTIEYLYTNGEPGSQSVLAGLVDYLATDAVRARIGAAGYAPCLLPDNTLLDVCRLPR